MGKFLELFSNNQVLGLAIGFISAILGIVGAVNVKGGSLSLAWWQRMLFLLISGFILWATNRPAPVPAISSVSPGTISAFAGPTPPEGWVLCDGAAYDGNNSRFEGLFKSIGQFWGEGTGGENGFNVPDLQGMFLRGANNDGSGDPDVANRKPLGTGKAHQVGSIQDYAIVNHNHSVNDPGHAHAIAMHAATTDVTQQPDYSSGSHRHDATTGSSPTNVSVIGVSGLESKHISLNEIRPSNAAVNYIIKL